MKKTKKIFGGLFIFVLFIFFYFLLFGNLFPFSPVRIGFTKYELTNTIIYVQNGSNFNKFDGIDTLTNFVENFHNLKFKSKPKIYLFNDDESYLHRTTTKARFCAYPNGSLVVSPWAQREAEEGKLSLEIYLKHELSHILLYQNMNFLNIFTYPDWLMEGIAVYSTNQMGTSFYPDKNETYNYIRQGNFLPPFDYKTKNEDKIKLDVKYRIAFMYSEFACIVDYLVSTYGNDKFLFYMKSLLQNSDHDEVFRQVYGKNFENAILDFKKAVLDIDSTTVK